MRHVRPPLIGCASLPKRALSASATWPAGTVGIDAVVVAEFEGAGAGGGDGTGRLLGPKISPRVAGTGEIRPADGVAENSEFWALAPGGWMAATISTRAGHSQPRTSAVASDLFMTSFFSAQIAAISSQAPACL